MKKFLILLIFTIVYQASAHAQSLNHIMSEIGETMTDFYPVIVTTGPLDKKQEEKIGESIRKLNGLFSKAKPFIKARTGTYQVSYDFIIEYLAELEKEYKSQKIDYVRSKLYTLGAICTSCHTQDTKLRTLFKGAERKSFPSDFSFAEFNYLTRNYDEAEKYYSLYLKATGPKTELELVTPLQRLVTIYTQIKNRPSIGAKALEAYTTLPQHTPITHKSLEGWIAGLYDLEKKGVSKFSSLSFEQIKSYVKAFLGPLEKPLPEVFLPAEEEVSRVWLRGAIYHYLLKGPPEQEVPYLLYWLALCDRSIEYNYFFTLADLYLKECINNYSKHSYAPRCYAEYREYMLYSYSGSAGTFLPPEVEEELELLKAKLESSRK
ncbi:MAG: hypothetical protein OEX00_03290 [Gammaproteobacteria bacterium]|nr:hypothetical protein [Gammaproteobacteria bacterium]MDH5691906.1 hypothetical protein [Gammaproteobacteria bacterium]